jgi:hypothetical protein
MLPAGQEKVNLPAYARVAAAYWSVDELARWASTLAGHDLHSDLTQVPEAQFGQLARYVPLEPPKPQFFALCEQALATIELLRNPETHSVLALTSGEFDWLPTTGGPIRDLAYDLLAPLTYIRLGLPIPHPATEFAKMAYLVPTLHYEISRCEPRLSYSPEVCGWSYLRYQTPKETWLQGLRKDQLDERLARFLATRNRKGELRLATKEEFKAEFDRVLASSDSSSQRSLGVLVNPLFGFSPDLRPIYWRILAIQYYLFARLLNRDTGLAPFNDETRLIALRYIDQQNQIS